MISALESSRIRRRLFLVGGELELEVPPSRERDLSTSDVAATLGLLEHAPAGGAREQAS
jgi:hypothetical protein